VFLPLAELKIIVLHVVAPRSHAYPSLSRITPSVIGPARAATVAENFRDARDIAYPASSGAEAAAAWVDSLRK
jgi:hypothetical protein